MGVALIDSSTVIGFLDADDPLHQAADAAVRATATEHVLAVSVVTLAEVLTGAMLGHHAEATVRRFLAQAIGRRIPLDERTAERAAELRAGHRSLKMPDALIIATGDVNADVVLTGDEQWSKVSGLACELRLVMPGA